MGDGMLAGPRGRRLCLEVARELGGEAVTQPLFWLSHKHAANPGTIFGWGWEATPEGVAARTDAVKPADLVGAIAAIEIGGLGSRIISVAFERSVDAAMYWQEADGDDVVAAFPEVIEALRPIAAAVEAMAETVWWREGVRSSQWALEWDTIESTAPVTHDGIDGLDKWRAQAIAQDVRAAAERPDDPAANWSGTWWNVPDHVACTTGEDAEGLPARLTLVEDGFGWTEATAIAMAGSGRVFEIREADDWAELCRRYPLELTDEHRHDWYRVTGRDGLWVEPDWRAVASDFDAVHLTAWAYLTAATCEIVVDDARSSMIAGWGPDATYWLTGTARETGERVGWRRQEQGEVWARV